MYSLFHRLGLVGLIAAMSLSVARAQMEEAPRPEEVIPLGPGYITKGYKTMINGEVVQTTDGRTAQPQAIAPEANSPNMPPPSPPPAGNWPEVVIIHNGIVTDPETMQPAQNLPPEIELIPLGLRKLKTDVIQGGETTQEETMTAYFRVVAKGAPAAPQAAPPPGNQHPASMGPEPEAASEGPDFSGLLAASEQADETAEAPSEDAAKEKKKSGGFFDFLFGESEPEKPEPGKLVIDLDRPLTQQELAALQANPEFQQYLRDRADDTSRNFYSSKGRGSARSTAPKLPDRIVVEEFKPEEWEVDGPTPPTPNMAVGKLVSVDAERQIAVCWLQTRYLRPDRPMITRNYEMQPTGVILPSGEQDGRAAGFWIAEGNPAMGDEVIIPGPAYESLVKPWLK